MTTPKRGALGRGLAALIPTAPFPVSPGQGEKGAEWMEELAGTVARRVAAEVVHKPVHKSDTGKAEAGAYDPDPAQALWSFYDDYIAHLDHVDPDGDGGFPRRDLVVALTFAQVAPILVAEVVDRLRTEHGWSWADIAAVAGTSRQAAAQRWGRPTP